MAALLPITRSYGQLQHPLIEYTTENGLSLNSVNDLLFDKQGFLWVTTADGLQRFDGYRFQTFKHDALDKKSIPENSVSEIYEDENSNLWITYRTGICFKPKGKNEFIDLTSTVPPFSTRLPLACMNETDSAVWVVSYPSGIYAINKTSLLAKKICSFPDFSEKDILYLFSRLRKKGDKVWFRKGDDLEGDLYLVSADGIKQFKNNEKIKVHFVIPEQKDSVVIIADKLLYKALTKDPFTPVRILKSSPHDFDNEHVTLPREIANDQFLLLGIKKILVYDAHKENVSVFPYNEYFSPDLIRYLNRSTADQHQNSWLGFNGIGGIKVISLQKFSLFNRPVKNALPYTITSDELGRIFVGIYYGGIEVYNKEGQFVQIIKLPETHEKFGSPRAMAMIDSATLIVRSTLNELYVINTRTGNLQILSHLLPPRSDSVFRDFESDMHMIHNGEVWFSYFNSILSLKKNLPGRQAGKTGYSCTNICTVPAREQIISFSQNDAGQVWIGTVNGVWLFEKDKFQKISMPASYVKHINQHPDGSIWVATINGLYILKNNRVSRHLNIADGLPNSFIYSVLFDDEGNSWVSTNRGIAKIAHGTVSGDEAFIITSYSAKEGLQGDEFNTRGYYRGGDGVLYFAGVNGINFFKPQNLVSKSAPSRTMLTKIDVNNLPYLPNLQPEFINEINLQHDQNNISLSFSCMDFTVPEKNQYKFWLKGFQTDWSLPQKNNTVQYILPPGEYQLLVLGSNYEGVWSKEPLVLNINILPPWYQTNLAEIIFLVLALAVVAASFYLLSRNRYQKKLRKLQMEQEMQKEKQRLSRDLHDNLGSQITWLSNNITQLERAELEHQPVEQKLDQLREGAGELMQTLRETIWILNKDKISCVDLFDKVVSLAARHIEVCPPMHLHTKENISLNRELSSGQALQIFRICQEAINNACKHAQASELTIKADSSTDQFTISIIDNGRGFDPGSNGLEGHYGLQNMKERAKETDLDLKILTSPGKGTTVTISTNRQLQ